MPDVNLLKDAELSDYAKRELTELGAYHIIAKSILYFLLSAVTAGIALAVSFEVGWLVWSETDASATFWLFVAIVFLLFTVRNYQLHKSNRKEVLKENKKDLELAAWLEETLERFHDFNFLDFCEVPDDTSWRPVRVKHEVSQSLRGNVDNSVDWKDIMPQETQDQSGLMEGQAVPNLLDVSTLLILANDEGETLRVLVPSPMATKQMFRNFLKDCGEEIEEGTHTDEVLSEFNPGDEVAERVTHDQLLDQLVLSLEGSIEERPLIGVTGHEIRDGVVIATTLTTSKNDQASVFLPVGFFSDLHQQAGIALRERIEEPNLLQAVGAE